MDLHIEVSRRINSPETFFFFGDEMILPPTASMRPPALAPQSTIPHMNVMAETVSFLPKMQSQLSKIIPGGIDTKTLLNNMIPALQSSEASLELLVGIGKGMVSELNKGIENMFTKFFDEMDDEEDDSDVREDRRREKRHDKILNMWGYLTDKIRDQFSQTTALISGEWQNIIGPEISKLIDVGKEWFQSIARLFSPLIKWMKEKLFKPIGKWIKDTFTAGILSRMAGGAGGGGGGPLDVAMGMGMYKMGGRLLGGGLGLLRTLGPIGAIIGAQIGLAKWHTKKMADPKYAEKYGGDPTAEFAAAAYKASEKSDKKLAKEFDKSMNRHMGATSWIGSIFTGIYVWIKAMAEKAGVILNKITPKYKDTAEGASGSAWDFYYEQKQLHKAQKITQETQAARPGQIKNVYDYLMKKGFSGEQAAGMVGNLIKESNLNPEAWNEKEKAFGIAQWRNERLDALKKFAGADYKNLYKQIDFMIHELKTSERPAGEMLGSAKTLEEVVKAMVAYERPKDKEAEVKIRTQLGEQVNRVISGTFKAPQKGIGEGLYDWLFPTKLDKSKLSLNCGETITENLDKMFIKAGADPSQLLGKNYGVGIPTALGQKFGVDVLRGKDVTLEKLQALGPGTAIGYNRPGHKWPTHAEMLAPYTGPADKRFTPGELAVASSGSGKGVYWKKLNQSYIDQVQRESQGQIQAANAFLGLPGVKGGVSVGDMLRAQSETAAQYDMGAAKSIKDASKDWLSIAEKRLAATPTDTSPTQVNAIMAGVAGQRGESPISLFGEEDLYLIGLNAILSSQGV